MCNKRRFSAKYNLIHFFRTILSSFLMISTASVLILLSSCRTGQVEDGAAVSSTVHHKDLYQAIEKRDFHALWELKDHADPHVSDMAIRATIHAEEIPIDQLFEETITSDHPGLWRVLSHQSLDPHQLRVLNRELTIGNLYLPGLCEVAARQGDQETLNNLLADPERIRSEERCSFAAGNLLTSIPVEEEVVERLFTVLNDSGDDQAKDNGQASSLKENGDSGSQTVTHLLYGLYRSDLNRPSPGSVLFDHLTEIMDQRKGRLTLTDEYLIRITAPESVKIIINNRPKDLVYSNVQVSVELASAITSFEGSRLNLQHLQILAEHPNPHVQVQLLESLTSLGELPPDILNLMAGFESKFKNHPETAIAFFRLMKNNGHELTAEIDELKSILIDAPYFADQIFELLSGVMDQPGYVELLLSHVEVEGIQALHASTALSRFVQGRTLSREEASGIQQALLDAAGDGNRSVLSGGRDLYLDIRFMSDANMEELAESYHEIASAPDTGLASALYSILNEISSANPLPEPVRKPFRRPDSQHVMNTSPLWVLETDRGEIVIELDPNTAPYTVSSILHLTEEGVYNGVVFHRVVRNFVVQSGDFDRKDGLGGPDYRIPTEPGSHTFYKGSVGIASSGSDTEGSQFFITLTPTPHLDGNYTLFGNVRSGMEVVDTIQRGDRIVNAYIK